MAKNEVTLLEKLLDAKIEPLKDGLNEIKGIVSTNRKEIGEAQDRIARYENRFVGYIFGAASAGGVGGIGAGWLLKIFVSH